MKKCGCCCSKSKEKVNVELTCCQSCSMPLNKEDVLGTNADGSKNKEYCLYCYKDGKFTDGNISMEAMIETCAPFLVKKENISLGDAKQKLSTIFSKLKRWQKK